MDGIEGGYVGGGGKGKKKEGRKRESREEESGAAKEGRHLCVCGSTIHGHSDRPLFSTCYADSNLSSIAC